MLNGSNFPTFNIFLRRFPPPQDYAESQNQILIDELYKKVKNELVEEIESNDPNRGMSNIDKAFWSAHKVAFEEV